MESFEITRSLTSRDNQKQQTGLENVKSLLTNFLYSNEANIISFIPSILELGSEKKHQVEIELIIDEIVKKINPYCFKLIFEQLKTSFGSIKIQAKIYGLKMICTYSKMHPEIISSNLPTIIDSLIELNSDVKKEVKNAVQECWVAICETIENVDIKPIIQVMIEGYINPAKTEMALEKLASTPFVNDIDVPTLGLLIPMLVRAMRERKVASQRKAALVMNTLCKLIKNPVYARIFYDKLSWILNKGIDEIAIEEVRNVCSKSKNTLDSVYEQANTQLIGAVTKESCMNLYREKISEHCQIILEPYNTVLQHTIGLVLNLINWEVRDSSAYFQCIEPYLISILTNEESRHKIVNEVAKKLIDTITVYEYNPEDEEENLCDCMFSLAYGTRVLLHQTPLKLKLGRIYGVLGHNGAGKSTLMRAMANKTLHGFPEIEATYIEHHIPEDKHDMITLDYVESNPKIRAKGVVRDEIISSLAELNVTEHMMNSPLSTLSGGNVQRVNLVIAKLSGDPLQLMDEPTNHIDAISIKWLKNYIKSCKNSTFLVISHDVKFLDDVCTNIIHYETLKLKVYRGNVTEFVKQKPEAAYYFQTSSQDVLSFSIPEPGPLEGVKSLTKSVLSMKNCYFQYPTAPKPQLTNITVQVSMASRIVIAGVNGAGKSTLVKLLVGEIESNQGIVDRHPNLRMAYIPQNISISFQPHEDKTPIEYVMWRYRLGSDREQMNTDALTMTKEEMDQIKAKAKESKTFIIKEFGSRRAGKREHEYEAKSEGITELVQWFGKSELIEMGYEKMVKEFDQKLAMESMMGQRKLTTGEIQKHMDSFGLEPELAQHTKIKALSSGQRMRCYLSATTFFLPHVIIFDEPTNFLDKESTSALSDAIKNFKGGVLVISHNEDFYNALTREKWLLENGTMTVFGDDIIEALEKERKKQEKENSRKLKFNEDEEKFDSLGNKIEVVKEKKELTRDEKKRLMKQKKEFEKAGQDTYEIDQLLGLA